MKPRKIQRTSPSEITITWDDGHTSVYTLERLRDNCPCATCNEYRETTSALLPLYEEGKYSLTAVHQVGSYAVQLRWGDGHDTGIFTFEYLRSLCGCSQCTAGG
jgi:DUF971 family protein